MNAFESSLLWITNHGYQLLLAGLVAVFFVKEPRVRRNAVRALLILGGIVVGSVFIAAAYGKMKPMPGLDWTFGSVKLSLAMFAMQVDSYEMLPPWAVNGIAHFLPYFELFLGIWLVTGILRRYAGVVASLALCGFMIAITTAYFRHLNINCGCGIGPPEQVGPDALVRDGLRFLLPALLVTFGAFWLRRQPKAETTTAPVARVGHASSNA